MNTINHIESSKLSTRQTLLCRKHRRANINYSNLNKAWINSTDLSQSYLKEFCFFSLSLSVLRDSASFQELEAGYRAINDDMREFPGPIENMKIFVAERNLEPHS